MMDSQYAIFLIGNSVNIGIKTSEPHIQFVYSDQNSVNILLSLNLKQFEQLIEYIPLLKRSLKRRLDTTKTLSEYETLLQQQTQFLIGNNVYVTISHLQDEPQLQFIEYHVIPSLTVTGQKVVCPSRLCMSLDMAQLQELSSQVCLVKTTIKKAKKKKSSKTLPEYKYLSSQKNKTKIENGVFVTDV